VTVSVLAVSSGFPLMGSWSVLVPIHFPEQAASVSSELIREMIG